MAQESLCDRDASEQHYTLWDLVGIKSAIGPETKGEEFNEFVFQYLLSIVAEVTSELAYDFP